MPRSFVPVATRSVTLLLLAAASLLVSRQATAQAGGPTWVSLTTSAPAGTPAEVRYDPSSSNLMESFFDVFVHGFWTETVVGPDLNTYVKIEIPGLPGSIDLATPGAPRLPAVRGRIAVATNASTVSLRPAGTPSLRTFSNFGLIWPDIIPERDDDTGSPPVFVRDESIYGTTAPGLWPPTEGLSSMTVAPAMDGFNGVVYEVYPCRWDPATHDVTIAAHMRFSLLHAGTATPSAPITKERGRLAAKTFDNWPGVQSQFPINTITYTGNFLFIYPVNFQDKLLPLINQKKARGFSVTELAIPWSGNTCESIRAAIAAWYANVPPERDKYMLLVGDDYTIPMCTSPALPSDSLGVPTDDWYGRVSSGEFPHLAHLDKEIHVGRLAVSALSDCANQVAKILAYEDSSPPGASHFDDVLLVAHEEHAPFKYQHAQEVVRKASYAVPPVFHTRYGAAGGTNAGIQGDIDDGMGLVAYRGHGSAISWANWNGSEYWTPGNLHGLSNGTKTPVVLSFACTNSKLDHPGGSISEEWVSLFPGGAVAAVGATTGSWTSANNELDRLWFKAIYDEGLTTISHAMEWAEAGTAGFDPKFGVANTWMYLLLGDPDMQIRRRNPVNWMIVAPGNIPPCSGGCPPITIHVVDQGTGMPVAAALVAAWKPLSPTAGTAPPVGALSDEVFDNRYTDSAGLASIPGTPVTEGWITFTVQDDAGNAVVDSIKVREVTGVEPQSGMLAFSARPSVTHARTFLSFGRSFSTATRISFYDVAGREVRRLEAASGALGVSWDGADASGQPVQAGLYFARFSGAGQHAVTRVVVTR